MKLSDWRAPGSPKEPLYDVFHLADQMNVTPHMLFSLMKKHPTLKPWRTVRSASAPARKMYRMSDFKRWRAALPSDAVK